jgi:alanine dehydrogenase
MRIVSRDQVARALPYPELIQHLRRAFRRSWSVPPRTIHPIDGDPNAVAALGIMPAWTGKIVGAKLVTATPGNAVRGLPTIQAVVVVFSPDTGQPLAVIDGTEITLRRTSAASALASTYLSRRDARILLVLGAGQLATHMVRAHLAVRALDEVRIWARRQEAAEQLVHRLSMTLPGIAIRSVTDRRAAMADADIVCAATGAHEPIIEGSRLADGAFVDLVGAHTPTTREADDRTLERARIYMDVRSSCLAEAGDILIPLRSGAVAAEQLIGDLADLCSGRVPGRETEEEIIVYKSLGTAIEDMAAAELVLEKSGADDPIDAA